LLLAAYVRLKQCFMTFLIKLSDLSSTQDEPSHNLHKLQQIRYMSIQMRYAYYCM